MPAGQLNTFLGLPCHCLHTCSTYCGRTAVCCCFSFFLKQLIFENWSGFSLHSAPCHQPLSSLLNVTAPILVMAKLAAFSSLLFFYNKSLTTSLILPWSIVDCTCAAEDNLKKEAVLTISWDFTRPRSGMFFMVFFPCLQMVSATSTVSSNNWAQS